MDQQPPDPRLGLVLQERYRIIDRVGEGAMAVVYRGERLTLGKMVAVKFLHPWVAAQPQFRVRFETEARAMSRLNHPNCVSVIDFGFEGAPFVVMDFVAGRTLRELMVETGPMEPGRAIGILKQILAGMGHAHAQGIVHRDIKPENMMLVAGEGLEDHVRILDFGLAKLHDGPAMTAGFAVGTPSYMSPEQTGGPGEIDGRTDIYAAGVVLFELLTGRKPFLSENVAEIFLMHRESAPPSLRDVYPAGNFSAALERVVSQALAKFAEDRFATAAAFAAALDTTPEAGVPRFPAARQTELKTEFDPSLGARVLAHLAHEKEKRGGVVAVTESGAHVDMEMQEITDGPEQGQDDGAKTIVSPVPSMKAEGGLPVPRPSGAPEGRGKPVPPAPGPAPVASPALPQGAPKAAREVASSTAAPKPGTNNKRIAAAILAVFFLFAGLSLVALIRNGRAGFAAAREQEKAQAAAKAAASQPAAKADEAAPGETPPPPPRHATVVADGKSKGAAVAAGEGAGAGQAGTAGTKKAPTSGARPVHPKPTRHQESSFFHR